MKKRIGLICLAILISTLPVFAGVNKVSVAASYAMSKGKESVTILGVTTESQGEMTAMGLKVQGTSFFSPMSDLGLSYKLGVLKTLSITVDGTTITDLSDVPLTWVAGVGAVYQIPATVDMFVELGVGADYSTQSQTVSGVTITNNLFSITAHAEINYAFNSDLFLNAGVAFSYPLSGTYSGSSGGITISGNFESSVSTFTPYVGLTFTY